MAFLIRSSTLLRKSAMNPKNFRLLSTRFTDSHEYVTLKGDVGIVGITQFAADALGDVVYVELSNVGKKYTAGSSCGSVESVKAASDIYSPIDGEVIEVNQTLETFPETVNQSPLEKGWFLKLKVSETGKAQFTKLMDADAYAAKTASK